MPQLKSSFIAQIRNELNTKKFSEGDFIIETPETGGNVIQIFFAYNDSYYFKLFAGRKTDTRVIETALSAFGQKTKENLTREIEIIRVTKRPGEFLSTEAKEIDSFLEALPEISKWCGYIYQDLVATVPVSDPLGDLREKLEDIEAGIPDKEARFSDQELGKLYSQVDALFEKLSEVSAKAGATEQELNSLKQEFERFKNDAKIYPKGMWARTTINKILRFAGSIINSTEGRALIVEEIKRAIGHASH